MADTDVRIYHDLEAGGTQVFAEGHIFATHVPQQGAVGARDFLQGRPEIRVFQGLYDPTAACEEPETVIDHRHELLLGRRAPLLHLVGRQELKCAVLGEKVRVPLLDGRVMGQVGHAVKPGYDRVDVGVFNQFQDLLGGEDDIAVNRQPNIVIQLPVERLLLCPTEHIQAKRLHTGKRDETAEPIEKDSIVAFLIQGHDGARPGHQEVPGELPAGQRDHNGLLFWGRWRRLHRLRRRSLGGFHCEKCEPCEPREPN